MHRPKNGKVLKYLALIGFVFVVYILQSMIFTHIALFGAKPLLLPVAAVCIGLYEGGERGAVTGIIAGMLCDLSFNQPTVEFTLLLTAIGLLSGILFEYYLDRGFPSCLLVCALVLIISAFVQMFPLLIYRHVQLISLLKTAFIQTAYSLVFAIPFYHICRLIGKIPFRKF